MKLKLLVLSITLFFASISINLDTQTSKTDMLCGEKWYVTSMVSGELNIPVPNAENMWMKFHKSGQHDVNVDNVVKVGKWEFTKNKDSILFTTDKGTLQKMKLERLEKTNLDITFFESGRAFTMKLKKEK